MSGRQGGKKKPLKDPKKAKKELDEDDLALQNKLREDKKKLAEAQVRASQKGPMGGTGMKKSKK